MEYALFVQTWTIMDRSWNGHTDPREWKVKMLAVNSTWRINDTRMLCLRATDTRNMYTNVGIVAADKVANDRNYIACLRRNISIIKLSTSAERRQYRKQTKPHFTFDSPPGIFSVWFKQEGLTIKLAKMRLGMPRAGWLAGLGNFANAFKNVGYIFRTLLE